MKNRLENIKITKEELRVICKDYEYDENAHLMMEEGDERPFIIKKIMQKLDKADFIIFSLYLEYGSERKVADLLGCSRTPLHNCLTKIKNQIKKHLNDN